MCLKLPRLPRHLPQHRNSLNVRSAMSIRFRGITDGQENLPYSRHTPSSRARADAKRVRFATVRVEDTVSFTTGRALFPKYEMRSWPQREAIRLPPDYDSDEDENAVHLPEKAYKNPPGWGDDGREEEIEDSDEENDGWGEDGGEDSNGKYPCYDYPVVRRLRTRSLKSIRGARRCLAVAGRASRTMTLERKKATCSQVNALP